MMPTMRDKIYPSDTLESDSERAAGACVPASCGELVQGMLDGQDFLINSPIDWYADVRVRITEDKKISITHPGIFHKLVAAVSKTLDVLDHCHLGVEIEVRSQIPRGKGLASSTSEISAAICATAHALRTGISLEEISRILLDVDRSTDGLYWQGVSRVDHLKGILCESFQSSLPIRFLILDTGGHIETLDFDREKSRAVARANESLLRQAVKLVRDGFCMRSVLLVGKGATMSARINQAVLFKPQLEDLIKVALEEGCIGVNCAHTGTALGVMYDPADLDPSELRERLGSIFGTDCILGDYALRSGQVKLWRPKKYQKAS